MEDHYPLIVLSVATGGNVIVDQILYFGDVQIIYKFSPEMVSLFI